MEHTFGSLRKEYTKYGNHRVMDTLSYRKDMDRIDAFREVVLADFPHLTPYAMKIVQYDGPRHQRMIGLEFTVLPSEHTTPKGYVEVPEFDTIA